MALLPGSPDFNEARVAANDAMVGLLISNEMSLQVLQKEKASTPLKDLAPSLPSRKRLNRSVGEAAELIERAPRHLAFMAIPFTVSVHQSSLVELLELVIRFGGTVEAWRPEKDAQGNTVKDASGAVVNELVSVAPHNLALSEIHPCIARAAGAEMASAFDPDELSLFDFVRHVRNRLTHARGLAGSSSRREWRGVRAGGRAFWNAAAGRQFPKIVKGKEFDLGSGELFATLAVCKRLFDDAERVIASWLPQDALAALIAEEYSSTYPGRFRNDANKQASRVRGYARTNYPKLAVSDSCIADAVDAL